MTTCTIVVPCYNESKRLESAKFLAYLAQPAEVSILFVNDGSRDGTMALLESLRAQSPANISIFDKQPNAGKAEAVRVGMLRAMANSSPEYVGFWDADLATPLEAIADLLGVIESRNDIDMVFGSRVKLLGRHIERLPARHYLGRVFATFASLVLGLPIYDTQCGAKIFRATDELKQVLAEPFRSRWVFDVEIIARFQQRDRAVPKTLRDRIYEYPLLEWRDVPGSKLKPKDFLRAALDLLEIRNRYMRDS